MKEALKELVEGAHGILAAMILVVITIFVLLGKMSMDQWIEMVKWAMGIFSAAHAVMAVGDNYAERKTATIVPSP